MLQVVTITLHLFGHWNAKGAEDHKFVWREAFEKPPIERAFRKSGDSLSP
jgi:hypothetical protein